jgi:hypothetical protein
VRERHKFHYVFVVADDGTVSNHRIAWQKRQPKTVRPFDLDELDFPVLENAYLWVLLFRHDRHEHHLYELVGEEELWGRGAVRVRFEPRGTIYRRVNEWVGEAWVDRETGQILRVVAYQYHHWQRHVAAENAARIYEETRKKRSFGYERITTEFALLRDGVRFPTEARIEGLKVMVPPRPGGPLEAYRVIQSYSDYELFSVRVADRVGPPVPDEP